MSMRVCHFSPNPSDYFSPHLFFSWVPPNPQPLKRWLWERGCSKRPGISETNCPVCFTLSPACLLVTVWMFVKRWLNPFPCLGTAVFHSSEARVRDTAKLSIIMSSVYLLNEVLGKRDFIYDYEAAHVNFLNSHTCQSPSVIYLLKMSFDFASVPLSLLSNDFESCN